MIFCALGATDSVGASCHYLDINGNGIALDAGTDPDEDGPASLPRFELIKEHPEWYIDHAIVTHAHHDHMGALPVLLDEFPHALVHTTRATRHLLDLLLPASARLQQRKLKEGSSAHEPLFDEEQVEMHSHLYLTHELREPFRVTGPKSEGEVKASFYPAGHILGSAGVLLEFEQDGEERHVFYTSDTNMEHQSILPAGELPNQHVDTLILESTLGADPEAAETTRKKEEEKLREAVVRTLDRGGTVLIPVFALGRAQEVLALIDQFKREGDVDEEVPVYTAGIMRAVADLYDQTRFITPRLDPSFQVFGVEQRRLPRSSKATRNAISEPSIHVVTSGMMFEGTASNRLAQELIEYEENAILRVGYAIEESPAHRLMEAIESDEENPEVVLDLERGPQPIRCDVERFRLSGHSHREDLLSIVDSLQPERVLLVHGELEAREWIADRLRERYPAMDVWLPQIGEPIEL